MTRLLVLPLIALGPPKSAAECAAVRAKREKARQTRSRVNEGRYSQDRTAYSAKATERALKAQELWESGLSQKAIASELQVSERQIKRYLRTI